MKRDLLLRRLTAQLLAGPPERSVEAVAERLLAIQAQDPRGFRLAFRSRSTGLSATDVDRALADRSLVVSWLNRGTLHLVRAEDHSWLHALTTPQLLTGNSRRLGQEGVPPDAAERGVRAVELALAHGPLTRDQLKPKVAAARVRVEGQALVHVLFLATLRGLIVRGPVMDGEQAFVLTRDWLGAPAKPLEREPALKVLARRFLAGHGPASPGDLAKWAGLGLGEARRAFSAIEAELREFSEGQFGLKGSPAPEEPAPKLLGAFDPLLHGWESREPIVGEQGRGVVTANGVFRPFALVGGRAVATWRLSRGAVELAPFDRIDRAQAAALQAEAEDVVRFLG